MPRCEKCNDWSNDLELHKCGPSWQCFVDDELWGTVRGQTRLCAAEACALAWWEDFPPEQNETITVGVVDGDETITFEVEAEYEITATASRKIEPLSGADRARLLYKFGTPELRAKIDAENAGEDF